MSLRLSHRPTHNGLKRIAYQAHVYDILTPAGDLAGWVQHNGDGHQLRWSLDCPYCGAALGDLSFGVWRCHTRRVGARLRSSVHPDIEARLLAAIDARLRERAHDCPSRWGFVGRYVRLPQGSARDRRRIERANRRAAARIYASILHTTPEPT